MLISRPRRNVISFVISVLAGIAAAGCSKDAAPSPRLETASSPATSVGSADSATMSGNSATTPAPAVAESAKAPPKPDAKPRRTNAQPANGSAPSPAAAGTPAAQDQSLKYDATTNTVTFELIGGPHGFQFNGYSNGGATLTLPSKANVVMNFINKDGTPHSAVVISGEGPIPTAGGEPAIPRAYTNQLLAGLPQEGSDVMRFQVPESGTYRIMCGVPGHGLSGMWIWMRVDPAAKTPSFGPTK